jgi:serine/threonine protein phosphatase 1
MFNYKRHMNAGWLSPSATSHPARSHPARVSAHHTLHPAIPAGLRVYAIGDIHGCADLLDRMIACIRTDMDRAPPRDALCVLLGDYIDRGPASARVLSTIESGLPVPSIALRGNHEQMLLDVLENPSRFETWRHLGGLETLHAFGISIRDVAHGRGFEETRRQLRAALTPRIIDLLHGMPCCYEVGDYFFCHAGVRPGICLANQHSDDLLWIREEFTGSPADHGRIVVHGHTPVETPDVRPNRINIDTGAYLTGTLTCLVLEGESRRFLST